MLLYIYIYQKVIPLYYSAAFQGEGWDRHFLTRDHGLEVSALKTIEGIQVKIK